MPDISVSIRGLDRLLAQVKDGLGVETGFELGIRRSAIIVEADAKGNVHKITRKLHDSTGHDITGSGLDTEGVIGPRPGFGAPRAGNRADPRDYARVEEEGFSGTQFVRAHQRKGGTVRAHTRRVNRAAHPWLVPALTDNVGRIEKTINDAIDRELERRF